LDSNFSTKYKLLVGVCLVVKIIASLGIADRPNLPIAISGNEKAARLQYSILLLWIS
jgi:hypothetical protein